MSKGGAAGADGPTPEAREEPGGRARIADEFVSGLSDAIAERLEAGKRVRRKLPDGGRINLDRRLPFLVVYREPTDGSDPGTRELATTSAAHLITTGDKRSRRQVTAIVDIVRAYSMEHFGAFLLIEIWARPQGHPPLTDEEGPRRPGFRLFGTPEGAACDAVLEALEKNLKRIKSTGRLGVVEVPERPKDFPQRVKPIYSKRPDNLLQIGIEVEPSFRDGSTPFPGVLRTLRTGLDKALRHAVFYFARHETKFRPRNYQALGRKALVKAVWDVDERLDRISSSFEFLSAVTPVNLGPLWTEFRKSNFERLPAMRYRPLPIDIAQTKRELFSIPVERIEDPTLVELFGEKQEELDRQLSMLKDRGTERFLLGSQQMYGRISTQLVRTAEELLERVPATMRPPAGGKALTPDQLLALGEREIEHYKAQWDGVVAQVRMRPNVIAGIMVSRGDLIIASDSKTREHRADALLQHEVGTHLLTYYNGKAQRFAQLKSGLAGYEEMQEGLAVLAEYLVSGMTPSRLRVLAARVLAARALLEGATFVDTFRLLCRYGFQTRVAFQIALRIYRGGGFIKDCVYLRGFISVLEYLRSGESFERLFVGKIAMEHLPIISELESRGVVLPPKLLPRYLEREDCQRRLVGLRQGKLITDLLDDRSTGEARPGHS